MCLFSTVAGERNDAETSLRAAKSFGEDAAIIRGEIEIVHRARDVEIGIGVEAIDERHALMAQIGFDLEIRAEAEGDRVACLQVSAERDRP